MEPSSLATASTWEFITTRSFGAQVDGQDLFLLANGFIFLTRWRLIPWPEGIPNYLVSALQPTTSHSAANSLHSKMAGSQTCKRDKSKQVLFPLKSFSTKLLTLLNALLKERSKANLFNPKSLCCLWVQGLHALYWLVFEGKVKEGPCI